MPGRILPVIVFSQFCCTSLWFAGNGVMNDLLLHFNLEDSALGHLSSAVQLGFITGTLIFAILSLADRFNASWVFFMSAIVAASFNIGILHDSNDLSSLVILRFFTGFFLAGIYPVGMKIAADYYREELGRSLGFLVGALVLGTAFPHLLKFLSYGFPWKLVLIATSGLALIGGTLMIVFVPSGPFRKKAKKIRLSAFFRVFQVREFRKAAFGYFGHMWELYAFWAFVPIMLQNYHMLFPANKMNIPILSFAVIGSGGMGCLLGAYLSSLFGTKKVAGLALMASCLCCVCSPLIFMLDKLWLVMIFLIFWGMVVIADSPLFSTLVARSAAAELKGTGLTIVNCIGFSITIFSIQLLSFLQETMDPQFIYVILALGPLLGLIAMHDRKK